MERCCRVVGLHPELRPGVHHGHALQGSPTPVETDVDLPTSHVGRRGLHPTVELVLPFGARLISIWCCVSDHVQASRSIAAVLPIVAGLYAPSVRGRPFAYWPLVMCRISPRAPTAMWVHTALALCSWMS